MLTIIRSLAQLSPTLQTINEADCDTTKIKKKSFHFKGLGILVYGCQRIPLANIACLEDLNHKATKPQSHMTIYEQAVYITELRLFFLDIMLRT